MNWKTLFSFGAVTLFAPAILSASTLSGDFTADDNVELIPISILGLSQVTIQTTSFATGGFEPVLTLYDPSGNLLFQDANGGTEPSGCGARATDPVSGFCLDAFIQGILNVPGTYTLALTEWDNIPSGPTLADGFPQTGNGNFTGPEFTGNPGSFLLFNGAQRTSDWALQIDVAPIPEPGSLGLALSAGFVAIALRRKLLPGK